ncbi:MAG: EF-P lysine aminoacylase GenX [Gammaproteobacteria bacterium]|nr:EF-P lysine aminoacylase GenX [Gammaproteobacteria bacterium]NNJ83568.1 EF-P lysine aminoacylase GenX [Gammaproteobacteria bacterium]
MICPQDHKDWRPAADLTTLRLRAKVLAEIRTFFAERKVLEVETPLLASTTTTEPHLASMEVLHGNSHEGMHHPRHMKERCPLQWTSPPRGGFLQTSPESFMKRLLATGSGPIFQICKAFRAEEVGRHHNPEFTILEWYRLGFDSWALMDEIDELMGAILGTGPGQRISYADAFGRHAGLDPFREPLSALQAYTRTLGVAPADSESLEREACLDLILTQVVQPALVPRVTNTPLNNRQQSIDSMQEGSRRHLPCAAPVFIFGFPANQASMAKLTDDTAVAERFELFIDGIELANGYRELGDSREQRTRFLADIENRREKRLPEIPVDERLLQALAHGLPDCAGVALGIDRLVMLAAAKTSLDEVLAFPFGRA